LVGTGYFLFLAHFYLFGQYVAPFKSLLRFNMSHLLKHKYAQYLARTLISKEDWDILRPKRDKASMAKKRAIVLIMVERGVTQRKIAEVLDTDYKNIQYWIRDQLDYARTMKRMNSRLARKGLAEFQLWAESQSK
jgi:hypothetical protein